jgi:Tfp pilus assembly protein PilN
MSDDVVQFFSVMMIIVVTGLLGVGGLTLIKALDRRLGGRRGPPALSPEELEVVRAQLAEVDGLRERIAELEERLDFAERLLAQRGETSQLPGRVE